MEEDARLEELDVRCDVGLLRDRGADQIAREEVPDRQLPAVRSREEIAEGAGHDQCGPGFFAR